MVKFKKLLSMVMVSVGILTFAGCGSKKAPNNSATDSLATSSQSLQNSTTSNSHNVSGSAASTSGEESASSGNSVTAQEKQIAFQAMRDNFSLTFSKDGGEPLTVSRFGNNTYAKSPSEEYYTSTEGDKTFTYKLESDEKWHKNESAPSDLTAAEAEKLFDQIDPTSCDYDSNTNVFSGNFQGGAFELCPGMEFTLPDFVDDTELVYENGKFNFVLLKQVLENWIRGDNYYNRDLVTQRLGDQRSFDKILYLDPSEEIIKFAIFYRENDQLYLRNVEVSTISGAEIYKGLASGDLKTSKDLKKALKNCLINVFKMEINKIEIDQTISKEDFDKMTQNIFNRLQTVGYQEFNVNDPGTIVDLKDAKIILGFASEKSPEHAGLGIGYKKNWKNYYIAKVEGKLKFLTVGLAASTNTNGDNYNVIQNREGKWLVTSYQETDLDNQNLEILENDDKDWFLYGKNIGVKLGQNPTMKDIKFWYDVLKDYDKDKQKESMVK